MTSLFVHRHSSAGILFSNPHIREYVTSLIEYPIITEEQSFTKKQNIYSHYQKGFIEHGVQIFDRAHEIYNKINSDKDNVEKQNESFQFSTYTEDNMIPIEPIDLLSLWFFFDSKFTEARLKAAGEETKNHVFSLSKDESKTKLYDFIPDDTMPEEVRKKDLTTFRLLKMFTGAIYQTWKPEHEDFIFLKHSGQFWKAIIGSKGSFAYTIPKIIGHSKWSVKVTNENEVSEDSQIVEANICFLKEIVNLFVNVRKKCSETFHEVGNDIF